MNCGFKSHPRLPTHEASSSAAERSSPSRDHRFESCLCFIRYAGVVLVATRFLGTEGSRVRFPPPAQPVTRPRRVVVRSRQTRPSLVRATVGSNPTGAGESTRRPWPNGQASRCQREQASSTLAGRSTVLWRNGIRSSLKTSGLRACGFESR